jgi:type II secretory pathway component PulF
MNYDEFAFFNQQLASMLRDGLPLEGSLRELVAGMKTGPLRAELQQVEAALARGVPLRDALARRALPPLFVSMVEIGARTNDLPGVLTLLADHYQRLNSLWTRLKGLMVYPLLVIIVSLGLSVLLSCLCMHFLAALFEPSSPMGSNANLPSSAAVFLAMWVPPVLLAAVGILGVAALCVPSWRSRLRWRLPAFRDASLAQTASSISLMLQNGTPLPDALAMAEALESGTPAAQTLAQWRTAIQAGQGKPVQWHGPSRPFPPLFLWLVHKSGENLTAGFKKAAELYQARAAYRTELALYGALPVSILFLGQIVFWQLAPIFRALTLFMNSLGGMGGN